MINNDFQENPEGTKSTIVAAATAATATITAIEHIQSKPSLLPQSPLQLYPPPASLPPKDASSFPPPSSTTLPPPNPSSHHVQNPYNIVCGEKPLRCVEYTLDNLSTADSDIKGLSARTTDNSNSTTDKNPTAANNNTTANNSDTTDNNDNDTTGKTDAAKLKENTVDDNNNQTSEDAKKYLEKRRLFAF